MRAREFNMTVNWFRSSGPVSAVGTFMAVRDEDNRRVGVRLIRVQVGGASMGRKDALEFDQPVNEWERAAAIRDAVCMAEPVTA